MTETSKMAYTEVLEIIKHLSQDEIERIPKKTIDFFEKNKDREYSFTYDVNETLEKQNVLRETNIIILKLFSKYFMSDEQNVKFKYILNQNENEYQKYLESKYDVDKIFEKRKLPENQEKSQETALVEIKQEGIIKRLINKIKTFFCR